MLAQEEKSARDAYQALADYGYDSVKLQSERTKIVAYDTANQQQEAAKGAAQQSTREQDAALGALNNWTAHCTKRSAVQCREKMGEASRVNCQWQQVNKSYSTQFTPIETIILF